MVLHDWHIYMHKMNVVIFKIKWRFNNWHKLKFDNSNDFFLKQILVYIWFKDKSFCPREIKYMWEELTH